MSYYQKINQYKLTHHSIRRIRERIFARNSEIDEHKILEFMHDVLENAIIDFTFPNGDIKLINHEHKIEVLVTHNKVIKTVIKK